MKAKISIVLILSILSLTGCTYTQSALEYSKEGTKRVEAGYNAKTEMTKALTQYLASANKNCGVKVEVINNVPVTTVKECVRFQDAADIVNKVAIVKPQRVADTLESAGNFIIKATNLAVPLASTYYSHKTQLHSLDTQHKTTVSNNNLEQKNLETFTNRFKKQEIQVVEPAVQVVENKTVQVVNPEVIKTEPIIVNPQIIEKEPIIVEPVIIKKEE